MKKTTPARVLAPLALLFCGSAFAQSQLTLYGIIDTNIEYLDHQARDGGGQDTLLRMNNSGLQGPRIGFRGAEDLGGGLKAIFTLEHGFNSDAGTAADTTRFFNRGVFLGLEGQSHRLTMGRQYTSLFDALLFISPLAYSGAYEPFSPLLGGLRNDNALKYRFSADGLVAQVHHSLGEQPTSHSANAAWGAYLSYVKDGWNATLAVDQQNGADTNGAHPRSRKWAVAAGYQLSKAWRLSAGYRWGQNKAANGSIALRDDFWWLGVNHQLSGALALNVAYYQDNVKLRNGVGGQPNMRQWTVQGIYALSKRSDVYLALARANNAGLNLAALSTLAPGATGQTGVTFGMRHRF